MPARGGIMIPITGTSADMIAVSSMLIPSSRMCSVKYGYSTAIAEKCAREPVKDQDRIRRERIAKTLTRGLDEEQDLERDELLLLEVLRYPAHGLSHNILQHHFSLSGFALFRKVSSRTPPPPPSPEKRSLIARRICCSLLRTSLPPDLAQNLALIGETLSVLSDYSTFSL